MLHAIRKNNTVIRKAQSRFMSEFFSICADVENEYQQRQSVEYMPEVEEVGLSDHFDAAFDSVFEGRE